MNLLAEYIPSSITTVFALTPGNYCKTYSNAFILLFLTTILFLTQYF